LPVPALRIGALASETSDGWADFVQHLRAAPFAFEVSLFPVRVQGVALRHTVAAGLRWFARNAAGFDVLCLLRGGGSRTDLSWWDDRELALAVAQHPLKVLVGIGHERDRTVLDFLAQSFKTPTAVAAHLVDRAAGVRAALDAAALQLGDAVGSRLTGAAAGLRTLALEVRHALGGRLAAAHEALGVGRHRLARGVALAMNRQRERLEQGRVRAGGGSAQRIERAGVVLERHETRLRLLDPRAVLRRGYAMVRAGDAGRIVTDAASVEGGAALAIEFRDGVVRARAGEVTIRRPDRSE
jgi:exodeoxyribonuclease VII large subunit